MPTSLSPRERNRRRFAHNLVPIRWNHARDVLGRALLTFMAQDDLARLTTVPTSMFSYAPRSPIDDFVAHLNAEVRSSQQWEWDEQEASDGTVIEELWWAPGNPANDVHLTITWRSDGSLRSLTADSPAADGEWQPVLREILERVDQCASSDTRRVFDTCHRYAYVGRRLSGYYEVGATRIEPWVYPDRHGVALERAVLVTVPFKGTDAQDAHSLSHGLASQFVAFLSVVLRVGIYIIRREERWTIEGRKTLAFPHDGRAEDVPEGQPDLSQADIQFSLMHGLGNEVKLPAFAESLWLKLGGLSHAERTRFGRAASLFNTGCVIGRQFPSTMMSYHVAAIECLKEPNEQSRQGFQRLIQAYCAEAAAFVGAEDVYGVYRSAHIHGGRFGAGEFEGREFGPIRGFLSDRPSISTPLRIEALSSTVLLRWLAGRDGSMPGRI